MSEASSSRKVAFKLTGGLRSIVDLVITKMRIDPILNGFKMDYVVKHFGKDLSDEQRAILIIGNIVERNRDEKSIPDDLYYAVRAFFDPAGSGNELSEKLKLDVIKACQDVVHDVVTAFVFNRRLDKWSDGFRVNNLVVLKDQQGMLRGYSMSHKQLSKVLGKPWGSAQELIQSLIPPALPIEYSLSTEMPIVALAFRRSVGNKLANVPQEVMNDFHLGHFITNRALNLFRSTMSCQYLSKKAAFMLFDLLDPALTKAVVRLKSIHGTFETYNMCVKMPAMVQLVNETPNLGPLLMDLYSAGKTMDQNTLSVLKDEFIAGGGKTGNWKFAVNQGHRTQYMMCLTLFNSQNTVLQALIGEVAMLTKAAIPYELMRSIQLLGDRVATVGRFSKDKERFDAWFDVARAIVRSFMVEFLQNRKRKGARDLANLLQDCCDVIGREDWDGFEKVMSLGKKANFNQIKRLNEAWHKEHLKKRQVSNLQWDGVLEKLEVNGYTVTPLSNSEALYQEGQTMRHCVGGYDFKCKSGNTLIFSLAKSANKESRSTRSTLELYFDLQSTSQPGWVIAQHRGFANAVVSKEAKSVGKLVLQMVKKADCNTAHNIESKRLDIESNVGLLKPIEEEDHADFPF